MQRVPEPEWMDVPERADAYAQTDFSAVNEAFVNRLLELTPSLTHARAVDLGTGPGDVPLLIACRRPGWRIAAVDASMPMLRHGRETLRANPAAVGFVLSDAKRLPFRDAAFDVVFSNSLLHHLPDPLPFWREVRRVARPGATIFVRDLFRPPTPADAQRLVDTYAADAHPLLREDFYNSFLAAFTRDEIVAQLKRNGLETLAATPITDRHIDIHGVCHA